MSFLREGLAYFSKTVQPFHQMKTFGASCKGKYDKQSPELLSSCNLTLDKTGRVLLS